MLINDYRIDEYKTYHERHKAMLVVHLDHKIKEGKDINEWVKTICDRIRREDVALLTMQQSL